MVDGQTDQDRCQTVMDREQTIWYTETYGDHVLEKLFNIDSSTRVTSIGLAGSPQMVQLNCFSIQVYNPSLSVFNLHCRPTSLQVLAWTNHFALSPFMLKPFQSPLHRVSTKWFQHVTLVKVQWIDKPFCLQVLSYSNCFQSSLQRVSTKWF